MNLSDIERLTKEYAAWRRDLSEAVMVAEHEISALRRTHIVTIKRKVAAVAEREALLKAAIEDSPELFKRPRSLIIDGIKVGFQKEKGKISWSDAALTIKLIKKHFADQAEILIKTTEKLVKAALQRLPAADLKRIGVTVGDTGDVVVIKSTDSEIDKLVEALLKGDEEKDEADEEAA
jgi:hypothetical protein